MPLQVMTRLAKSPTLTKLEANIRSVTWAALQPDFDPVKEYLTRRDEFLRAYNEKLSRNQLRRKGWRPKITVKSRGALKLDRANFDPSAHIITTPTEATFFSVVEQRGHRYTQVVHPTRCKIHDEGPVQERQLQLVEVELLSLAQSVGDGSYTADQALRKEELTKLRRNLVSAVNLYHTHLQQYALQRSAVQSIEQDLGVGEAVVYRDFVNDHDCESGNKVCNLVLVIRSRVEEGVPLKTINVHNFGDEESCDIGPQMSSIST